MISMRTKRYTMPSFWPVPKKQNTYVTSPRPGPHGKGYCIPLQVILRDVLNVVEKGGEAKSIISSGKVYVDKKVRKDIKYPVGLQDVLEIPDIKKYYRMTVNDKGLTLKGIKKKETDRKLCKLTGKTILKGGVTQLNCHDGRNLVVKGAKKYGVGDSILIKLPDQSIIKYFPLKKGEPAVITAGKNIGVRGKIKNIKRRVRMQEKSVASVQSEDGEIRTLLNYIMVGEIK